MPLKQQDPLDTSADIIDFTAYRNRDLIDLLETALEDARAGRVDGAIVVLQRQGRNHGVAVVGSYAKDARRVCGIAGEIFVHFMPETPDRPLIIED
jgi:hypothetical protein